MLLTTFCWRCRYQPISFDAKRCPKCNGSRPALVGHVVRAFIIAFAVLFFLSALAGQR